LVLTTYSYPYGSGETFLANELPYLSKAFQKIILVPEHVVGEAKAIPLNCEVRTIKWNNQFPLRKMILQFGIKAFKHIFFCNINDKTPQGKVFYAKKKWKIRWLDLLGEHFKGIQLVKQLPELMSSDTVLYHYWMIDFARYCSWMKLAKVIFNKQVCRIHGYDFNPIRHPKNHFPFRLAELKSYDSICAVSNFGQRLMSELHPEIKNKIALYRLGVDTSYLNNDNKEGAVIKHWLFVSTSAVIPEKRVEWILEAICNVAKKNPKMPFQWHHFGGGPTLFQLQEQAKQCNLTNLSIHFHGNTPNEEVLNFYKLHEVDAFIHASATEGGCPVAIQEAFAHGIPFIGLANEGAAEMKLNDFTEVHSDSLENLCSILVNFVQTDDQTKEALKQEALHVAKSKYAAAQNYPTFIQTELIC
jgi:glycosyltransferase involved in cell wall biosynthesis